MTCTCYDPDHTMDPDCQHCLKILASLNVIRTEITPTPDTVSVTKDSK